MNDFEFAEHERKKRLLLYEIEHIENINDVKEILKKIVKLL